MHLAQPCAREGRSMLADEHVSARLARTPTLTDLEQNQHAFVDGITHFLVIYRDPCLSIFYLGCSHTTAALVATHFIVFREEIVVCDVRAQQDVAHQVDEAQTQALESRYGAGKECERSQHAEATPFTL